MNKKREIFLYGAGAVIDWNAPPTKEFTRRIRETGFFIKNSQTRITEFIYQRLIKYGYEESEVNFETIINVIEELIVYYSEFNSKSKTPSLLKAFLSENDLSELFNYSIKGGVRKHGFQLQVPCGMDYNYSGFSYWDENPDQFFLQHLINLLLSEIRNIVSEYSYNTEGHSVIETESKNSLNFRKLFKSLSRDSIIRLYTLNYDNLFKGLLEKENINCFDGKLKVFTMDFSKYIELEMKNGTNA